MKKTHKKEPVYLVAVRIPVKWKQEVFRFPNKKAKTDFIKTIKKEYPIVEFIQTVEENKQHKKRKGD